MSILTSCVSTVLLIIIITCLQELNETAVLALWETSVNWEKDYRSTFVYLRVSPLSLCTHTTQKVPIHLCRLACMYVDTRICTHTHSVQPPNLVKYSTHRGTCCLPEELILQMLLYILSLLFKYMQAYTPRGYVLCPASRHFPTDVS